ncbi:hypothetical protein [Pseudoalteromonas sp. TB41]|uniref:hypothetical protein n=1 Tax=Pseudoalteromonas sp. TB41 TaxID=985149 RepID=UPI0003FDC3AE|nr:hypothetical protein [Pseudoalteromonas sp. TB41]
MKIKFLGVMVATATLAAGCGGGGSDSGSGSGGVIVNPPPVSSVDYPINNSSLVKYSAGDYIQYDGRVKLRESDTYVGFDQSATVLTQYQNPIEPFNIDSGKDFLITQLVTLESGDVVTDKYHVIQTESAEIYTIYNSDTSEYNCARYEVNDNCIGLLTMPGEYFKSDVYTQTGFEGSWFSGRFDKEYAVTHTLQMGDTVIVDTQLGTFETYPLKITYLREDLYFPTLSKSIVGTYWIHPDVGVVKAEYVRKESNSEVYEVNYSIVDSSF